MIDYAFKSVVLNSGLVETQRRVNTALNWDNPYNIYSREEAKQIDAYMQEYAEAEWKEASKINHAYRNRVKRLRKRIEKMIAKGNCIFVTLTFTDSILQSTSPDTRKKYVKNYLASQSSTYVANIDFGKENHREHYHALVQADKIKSSLWQNKCGAINFKKVLSSSNPIKLAKYISKLTNHAIKETTQRNSIIYSR